MANPKCIFEFPSKTVGSYLAYNDNKECSSQQYKHNKEVRKVKDTVSPDVLEKLDNIISKSSKTCQLLENVENYSKRSRKLSVPISNLDSLERTSPLGTKVKVNFKIKLVEDESITCIYDVSDKEDVLMNGNVQSSLDDQYVRHTINCNAPKKRRVNRIESYLYGSPIQNDNHMCSKDSNSLELSEDRRVKHMILEPKHLLTSPLYQRSFVGVYNHCFVQEEKNSDTYGIEDYNSNGNGGDIFPISLTMMLDDGKDESQDLESTYLDSSTISSKGSIKSVATTVSTTPKKRNLRKLFSQCMVIFGAFWICFFSLGIPFSIATFLPIWLEEFEDGRARTALIQSVLVGILFGVGTLAGVVIDRFGIRLTVTVGSLLSCAGFIGAVFAPNTIVLVISIGLISGIGLCCVYLGSVVAVSAICSNSASIAIGIIIAGGGLGQSVLPYFNDYLEDLYGWRGAFYVIAGLSLQPLVFGYFMTVFIDRAKSDKPKEDKKTNTSSLSAKLKKICCLRYILTCLASCIGFASTNGFFFIILDFAANKHGDGVFFIFLITTVSTVFNIGFGLINMIPFVSSSFLLSVSVMVSGAALVVLSFVTTYLQTVIFIVVFGVTYGGKIGICGVVVLDLVGRDAYSLAMGITITVNGIASSLGGLIFGLLYDLTQSYDTPLIIMGSLACFVGTFPLLGIMATTTCQKKGDDVKNTDTLPA